MNFKKAVEALPSGEEGYRRSLLMTLDKKTNKVCEQGWLRKHGNTLLAGRMLVSTQMAPMHQVTHATPEGLQHAVAQTHADSRRKNRNWKYGRQCDREHLHYLPEPPSLLVLLGICVVCVDIHEFFSLAATEATVTQQGSCHPLYEVAEPLILRQTAHTSTSGPCTCPKLSLPTRRPRQETSSKTRKKDKQGTDLESRLATCNVSRICRVLL